MKKLILFLTLALTGLTVSCVDKDEEVDADSKPSWLNGSIYDELENPVDAKLTGTFSNYLRLIDDLGYKETLSRTGSKTVFPANDEAFDRFFKNNDWGVSSYEQLTLSQKKTLLYSSMLDNALLLGMLPNVSNGTAEVLKGMAVRHQTNMSVIDTITHYYGPAQMPQNNKYWTKYYNKGLYLVCDNTTPMMVHLTREQMVNNNITISGENSDFEILTGSPYSEAENSTYIFGNKVINGGDVVCMNGYIHQLEDVLVPPGNMAQVIRSNPNTRLFSRVLDYFSAPYYDGSTTLLYNNWAVANGQATIDSIFQMRYRSSNSQGSVLMTDPDGNPFSTTAILSYDPGCNQYTPSSTSGSATFDTKLTNMGAMFVPDDQAMIDYFTEGGIGAYLIDIYGNHKGAANTKENLEENLDSLFSKNPQVLTSFVKNLQKTSFTETVPSKFTVITNDASENMGMNMSLLKVGSDGKYDVEIANNGVVYVLNSMIAPDEYQAVLAPSSSYEDMRVMNWAVQDREVLGVDFKYYLLAMSANYAFFIPDDAAFVSGQYYVNPVTLGEGRQAEALEFTCDAKNVMHVYRHYYDKTTGQVDPARISEASTSEYKTQLIDLLNFHTVVLGDGETLGTNHYYKTKHGGEIYVDNGTAGTKVMSGASIDNGLDAAEIEEVYNEKNGRAYRLDRVIQAPQKDVKNILAGESKFSEFYNMCMRFTTLAKTHLQWMGITDAKNDFGVSMQDQYAVFTSMYGSIDNACIDENVKFFNTYNYTLYAPNNDAMAKAYADGLPRWEDVDALCSRWKDLSDASKTDQQKEEEEMDKKEAIRMVNAMRDFVRYHFQTVSVYADNVMESKTYQTMCTDELGVSRTIEISGGGGTFTVTDGLGQSHVISANSGKMVNQMAREYWFDSGRSTARQITTSSFCVVHEIDTPMRHSADYYDGISSAKVMP